MHAHLANKQTDTVYVQRPLAGKAGKIPEIAAMDDIEDPPTTVA